MHTSFSQTVEDLRQNLNAATATLAASRLEDENAIQALLWAIQHLAGNSHAILQDEGGCERTGFRLGEEEVSAVPLHFDGTAVREYNPVLFTYPFAVAPFTGATKTEFHLTSTCAIALFNLGLALHNRAYMTSGEDRHRLLGQAKDFYAKAHDLLDTLDMMVDGTLITVYLACCNNLAEAYIELKNKDQADDWQKTLCESFLSVPPAKSSPIYAHFFNVSLLYNVNL